MREMEGERKRVGGGGGVATVEGRGKEIGIV